MFKKIVSFSLFLLSFFFVGINAAFSMSLSFDGLENIESGDVMAVSEQEIQAFNEEFTSTTSFEDNFKDLADVGSVSDTFDKTISDAENVLDKVSSSSSTVPSTQIQAPALNVGSASVEAGTGTSSIGDTSNTDSASTEALDDGTKKEDEPEEGYSLSNALRNAQDIENSGNALVLPQYMPGVSQEKGGEPADFTGLLQNIINGLAGIAGGVAVLFIVINAARLVFAVGGSDEISNAKKGLTWALGGLVLIIFSYIIAKTVITLVYSGENFDDPVTSVEEESVEALDPICATNLNLAETSCYELKEDGTQTKKSGTCSMESSSVQTKICESMKLSKHMTENMDCGLENIQHALKNGGFYSSDDEAKGWAEPDGKYGMATERAMIKYYEGCGCGETKASSETSDGSGSVDYVDPIQINPEIEVTA